MAKTAAPESAADFWDLLAKSGLFDDDQLVATRQELGEIHQPPQLAERLVNLEKLSSWQAQQLLAGQFVLRLADYRLFGELGEWDFGRPLLAQHLPSHDRVHLKLLSSRFLKDEQVWKETMTELRAAARVKHPQLLSFRDLGRAGNRYFLITDAHDHATLAQSVERFGRPGAKAIATLMRQLSEALGHLHQKQIKHGCLRPAAVFIAQNGSVQIGDVGLGKLLHAASGDVTPALSAFRPPQETAANEKVNIDCYAVGKIGAMLLDHAAATTGAAPAWWSAEVDDSAAREQLHVLCRRLMGTAEEAAPLSSADSAVQGINAWQTQFAAEDAAPATHKAANEAKEPASKTQEIKSSDTTAVSATSNDAEQQSPVGPVVIDTKRRKKATTKKVAAASAAPTAGNKSQSRFLIITTAALVLVVASLAGASWLKNYLADSDAREVAQQTKPPAAVSAARDEAVQDVASDPVISLESDPVIAAPAGDAANGNQPAEVADDPSATATGAPAGSQPDIPAFNPVAETKETAVNDASPPQPTANATQPTVPTPEPNAPTVVDSVPSPSDAPPPVPAAQPAATDTPPPPATVVEAPYRELPGSVELPDIDSGAGEAATLGTIHVDDAIPCFLELLGGDRLPRGLPALKLENAEGGTAARKWDVFAVQNPGTREAVAQFSLLGGKLQFQWLPAAAATTGAGMLQNCFLQVNIANDIRSLGLRKTVLVKPLVLDLDRGLMSEKYDISNPPDPSSCRLEIISLEGPFPPHSLQPEGTIAAEGGTQWILLGEKREEQVMTLHLESSLKKQFQLNVTALLQLGEEPNERWVKDRDRRITKSDRTQYQQNWALRHRQLAQQLAQANAIDLSKVSDRGQKQELERRKNLLKVDHDKAEAQHKMADRLVEVCDALNDTGTIHFRIVFEIDGKSVELLRSAAE